MGGLLIFRCGERLLGLGLEYVEETLRPRPIEWLPDLPPYVSGLSVVRGEPIPVIDLRALLRQPSPSRAARLITVRPEPRRRVGLLVDEVLGVEAGGTVALQALPPLLQGTDDAATEGLALLDQQTLMVLRAARLLPEDVWTRIAARDAP